MSTASGEFVVAICDLLDHADQHPKQWGSDDLARLNELGRRQELHGFTADERSWIKDRLIDCGLQRNL